MSRPERAVFRLPGVSLVIPFLLFVCVTPLANAGPAFWLALYVFPVAGLAYILLTRTVADSEVIRTTGLLGSKRIAWVDLDGLEFHGPRWAIAVGTGGRRFRLPMVRPRDLPRLAQVSGGRLLLGRDAPVEPDQDQDQDQDQDHVEVAVASQGDERADAQRRDTAQAQADAGQRGTGQPDAGQIRDDLVTAPSADGRSVPLVKAADGRPADE